MGRVVAGGLALTLSLLVVGAPAFSQAAVEGQGVADRARPDYDPVGHPVGSFLLYPSLTATVNETDNYRATNVDRQSDVYFTLAPELDILSNWNRNRLGGKVFFSQGLHAKLSSENSDQYGASANGQLDIDRQTAVTAEASVNHFVESRSSLGSFQGSPDPVEYEVYHAATGVSRQFNRLTLHSSVGYNVANFHDVRGYDGNIIDQSYRNYNQFIGNASAQYALSSGIGLIVSGESDRQNYKSHPDRNNIEIVDPINRNSTGYTIEGGVTFELSSLVFGSIQVGLINRNYQDARLRDLSGPTYNASIMWNVTPLTTLQLRADRSIEDTSSTIAAGNTRDDFSIGVDHELFRYVILSANGSYGHFRPNGPGVGGTEIGLGGSAKYLFNHRLSGGVSAQYSDRTSSSSFLRYHATTFGLFLKFAY